VLNLPPENKPWNVGRNLGKQNAKEQKFENKKILFIFIVKMSLLLFV
jgi:hypothetical protein